MLTLPSCLGTTDGSNIDKAGSETHMTDGRPALNKSDARGIVPGPSSGTVKSYSPNRNPFGGFITDDASGIDIFVHKSVVEQAKLAKIEAGQKVKFDIVEDGFGGFKAAHLTLA
jgi:cold shock CspA family protein